MPYETIAIADLIVNPSNDRHGPLNSETAAISWLFENRYDEMKGLAKDIVVEGKVFDAPLAYKSDNKFVVYDGNRRTACLKILLGLVSAPQKVTSFFQSLQTQNLQIPDSIECQIEPDFDTISKILTRRHSGKLEGEGQIKWDTRAKANYAERAGSRSTYPISEKIEAYLKEKGYPNTAKIPRSNLAKIIDTKIRKSRVGIELDQSGNLRFTKDEKIVYPLLVKIADDLISGKLSLKQLLLSEDKNKYLNDLSEQGFSLSPSNPEKRKPTGKKKPNGSQGKRPKNRRTLIPQDIQYTVDWRDGQSKIKVLWEQLQYQLKLDPHSLSVAIVFRVFLEQITENYLGKHSLKNKGSLNKNIVVVSNELFRCAQYDVQQHNDVERKVNDAKSLSSIASLQRVLHSKSDLPANSDMISLWDSLEPYILSAIKN